MSSRRAAGGIAPIHILLLVAFLEVAINRVAVPMLRPLKGTPPTWHTVLDYSGLFLFYFTGTLAAFLIFAHVAKLFERRSPLVLVASIALALAGVLAAVPLVMHVPAALSIPLETVFALAVILLLASALGRHRDVGAQLGLISLALPLLLHTASVYAARYVWPEGAFDGPVTTIVRLGVMALSLAALVSPYVFAPRPFARAVTRPGPVLFAMGIAALGAIIARSFYSKVAKAASLAIGVELSTSHADPRLALYLLAIATLAWTLASCAFAESPARRQIGSGIALVVLGGYGFHWPNHYLLPLFGFALVADAITRVREEELSGLPIAAETPPIADAAWSAYVGTVKAGVERTLANVHTLTTRGEGGLSSSVIVGDRNGLPVRTRIERIDGGVIAIDVVLGREYDEMRGATLTLWAIPPRELGVNPAGPPAAPVFKTGDVGFDERFRARGNRLSFDRLFDDGLRARIVATLDGWFAYWAPEGMRYRVYPGRGAPLDHPIALSDLALGRTASPDRLVAVIELLVEIAERGIVRDAAAAPSALDAE
ncbi:MAG TPA: hypothetical protein VMZ53_12570 [Kofleriaceae bacterium]|nr:hypothetical protein [Kofleriaceae bacterium]